MRCPRCPRTRGAAATRVPLTGLARLARVARQPRHGCGAGRCASARSSSRSTLTALAVVIACVWMALAIQSDLFDSRLQQVLTDAQRATAAAQTTLDNAAVQGDGVQLQNLMVERLRTSSPSSPRAT